MCEIHTGTKWLQNICKINKKKCVSNNLRK